MYVVGISLKEVRDLLNVTLTSFQLEEILSQKGWEWQDIFNPRSNASSLAKTFIGANYKLGASVSKDAPREFDCSSFTAYLYAQVGVAIPRMSVDQYVFSERINIEEAKEGDLIFSNSGNGNMHYESKEWMPGTKVPEGVDHVGLYLGEGRVIHASRSTGVSIEEIAKSNSFKNIIGFGRVPAIDEERYVVTVPENKPQLRNKENLIRAIASEN